MKPQVTILAADREIVALDSGHYKVTALWLSEQYETTAKLLQALEECKYKQDKDAVKNFKPD
jgi:hypothetical protein